MKKITTTLTIGLASFALIHFSDAQTIDYGMYSPNRLFSSSANFSDTSLRLTTGTAVLGTFTSGLSHVFAGKDRATLFSEFTQLSGSLVNNIGQSPFLSGRFALASIPTTLATNTPLFALVTTGADLTTGNFVYLAASSTSDTNGWFAPNPSDPLGSTIAGIGSANVKIYGGQGVWSNPSGDSSISLGGNLAIVPEPSTYALMALGGLVLFFIARRRKAQQQA